MSSQIHWHEGLFLQPHHLQALQRAAFSGIWGERAYSMSFPYGIVEAELSRDDLADHRVRFSKLHALMPGGAVIRFPEDAVLPSLDIRAAFRERPEGFTVCLALPLWLDGRPNTIDYGAAADRRQKLIYTVAESEVADENTGRNTQPVQTRRLNAMLMFQDEDFSDMEYIPILKVVREVTTDGAGLPRPDPRYTPPTLLLRGAPGLYQMVRDLTSQICATRDQLSTQLANTPLDLRALAGSQFEHMTRLRCLNRSAALLPSYLDDAPNRSACAGRVPLFDVYLALKDLLAELTALYPAKGVQEPLPYDHDDPYPPFADLDQKIRAFLGGVTGPRYRKLDFYLEDGIFLCDLSPDFFKDAVNYYLAIETEVDAAVLMRMVEQVDDFKLQPVSYLKRTIRGLPLKEERTPPFELPVKARQYYYRVSPDTSGLIWEQFRKEPQGVVHFEHPDKTRFRITLYATLAKPVG